MTIVTIGYANNGRYLLEARVFGVSDAADNSLSRSPGLVRAVGCPGLESVIEALQTNNMLTVS